MASVKHTAIIDADPQSIWHVLRQFNSIAEWHSGVAHCTVEDGKSADTGGSIRKLMLADGGVVRQRLLSIDNDLMELSYGHEESELCITDFLADIKVRTEGDGSQSTVTWQAHFDMTNQDVTCHSVVSAFIIQGQQSLASKLMANITITA
ncbi:SRPBCC family protein [Pseudomonas coleopterorum]|uniref:SRPBCC family protein n=1 Tax=Pseudomonas coleopterorum TaxID=1605838 RepID=UPI0017825813|nr:SRPBCC family protein [Pseudomonas coleopterorum]